MKRVDPPRSIPYNRRDYLISACGKSPCNTCEAPVSETPDHRWFITMGHPGYNSAANNRDGYASKAKAVAAYRRHCK